MLGKKRFLGIIPARGGSTRLPNKNIYPLNGRPMMSYIIENALRVRALDRLIVSTDHEAIAKVARDYGADVPFMRNTELAANTTPMLPVVMDALERLEKQGEAYDYVVILQGNSPLTITEDIERAINKALNTPADIVFSVCECPHPPQWSLRLHPEDEPSFAFLEDTGKAIACTQDEEPMYRSTGAIYVASVPFLKARPKSARLALPAHNQNSAVIVTEPLRSVDVDTIHELLLAEATMAWLTEQQSLCG